MFLWPLWDGRRRWWKRVLSETGIFLVLLGFGLWYAWRIVMEEWIEESLYIYLCGLVLTVVLKLVLKIVLKSQSSQDEEELVIPTLACLLLTTVNSTKFARL